MRFGNLFFRLPRLTILAIGFISIVGISALNSLPRQEDPTMAERFGQIETRMPGASAVRMESLITEKVENALREIPEVKTIESISRSGYSLISAELYDRVAADEVDLIWSEVRDKMTDVRPFLPAEASMPEVKARGPLGETLAIAVMSEGTPISVLERIALELKARIASMPATKETDIRGAPEQEIRIDVDPFALARTGLSIDALSAIIMASDTKRASGQISGALSNLNVEVKGEFSSTERISSIPLRQLPDGGFIRVGDLAVVRKTIADPPNTIALVNGKRAIVVSTTMEAGNRVDLWSARVKKVVDAYADELPNMVEFEYIVDQNEYTEDRLVQLVMNMLMAIALVLVALLVSMGIRSALIVGSALPMTIALVLGGLSVLEVPLEQLSVTGLIIALGLLIDNAIVVVEDYRLERRDGHDFGDAIANSIAHLTIPLLASTATTIFAFMPIAMTPGGVGDFTGSMAVCVILSVGSSFFLALTIIPAIAGFVDKKWPIDASRSSAWWINGISMGQIGDLYQASIRSVVEKPWKGVAIGFILPVVGFALAPTMTLSFFPPTDRNQFQVQLELPATSSIYETWAATEKVRQIVDSRDEVVSSHWFIGESAPRVYYNMLANNDGIANFANGFVTTKHIDDPRDILIDLQKTLTRALPGARVMALPFEQGPPVSAPIAVRIIGPDIATLKRLGNDIRLILSRVEEVTYTSASMARSTPQLSIYPNEAMARKLDVSNIDIPRQISGELSGLPAGTVMEGATELPVMVRLASKIRSNAENIAFAPIMSSTRPDPTPGNTSNYHGIPLEQLAELVLEPTPDRIDRYQGERTNIVSGYLLPYTIPSVPTASFQRLIEQAKISVPPGYRIEFGGEAEERGEAVGNIISTFVFYLWLMIAVIVISLNSFRYAGAIGLVGVLSIGLALFGVRISGYPMGYMAFIGTLGLIGLAINGAIIVLSALKANRAALAGDQETIVRIVVDATRHIVSTTVTTIGGFIPLILFGGHFWPPLAMAIAGGVGGSAILALYLIPAMFVRFVRSDLKHLTSERTQPHSVIETARPGASG